MAAEDFVRIENVTKRFRDVAVVDRVSLSLTRGEFFSLLGPSGCGKTTLLRIIGGFTDPDQGIIRIEGTDLTARPPEQRPVNMVFQSYAIFPHLSVAENIAYGLRRERLSRPERDRLVRNALNLISLRGYEERRANELSGGERQRVALARALVKRPRLLLLDEPLGALDKQLRESMQMELRRIQREVGITFLFVTHDQDEALAMSDRIAVMDQGRVLQVDDARTLYAAPSSRAVASFIGTMNFLDGEVISSDSTAVVVNAVGFGQVRLAPAVGPHCPPGASVVIAIRPEKLSLTTVPPAAAVAAPARINSVVFLGDRTQTKLSLAQSGVPVTASAPAASAQGETGTTVYLSFDPGDAQLFPA